VLCYINRAVHCAAARGHLDCVKALHDASANMWVSSEKGDCPVHEAAMAKHNGMYKRIMYSVNQKRDYHSVVVVVVGGGGGEYFQSS